MNTGAVFHPGHDELHGMTVVLFTEGPRTYVGRWDSVQDAMILLVGACMHEKDNDPRSRDQFLAETKTYGVPAQFQRLTVPQSEVTKVMRLGDLEIGGVAK